MVGFSVANFCSFASIAIIALGALTSCEGQSEYSQSSTDKVAGTSQLTVIIDSVDADKSVVDSSFYMKLMTPKDTFIIRPVDKQLSFPALEDSLTSVRVYYNDRYFETSGKVLVSEYKALYFPNEHATIIIDNYPFEHPTAKSWLGEKKERVYYEIKFKKLRRYFLTFMILDSVNVDK
ncbi:hypothetical protein [Hymenobacter sp. B81]|uniref:hypothetical protein n=1 Tax=Hymenobacter sp. B81 TaxID=3344878 RepID=UPI0037DC5371